MKKGDHIRVRNGTKDPDFKGKDLSGYTGTIEEIVDDNLVGILWDEATLQRFDAKFIEKCDRKNLDHRGMALSIDGIEMMGPRLITSGFNVNDLITTTPVGIIERGWKYLKGKLLRCRSTEGSSVTKEFEIEN